MATVASTLSIGQTATVRTLVFLSETLNSAVLCCMNKSPVMNFRCVIIIITLCLAVSAGLCSRWKHCVQMCYRLTGNMASHDLSRHHHPFHTGGVFVCVGVYLCARVCVGELCPRTSHCNQRSSVKPVNLISNSNHYKPHVCHRLK